VAERISGDIKEIANAQPNTDVVKNAMSNLAPGQYSDKISTTMADMVKGRKQATGFDATDDHTTLADGLFRAAVKKGFEKPAEVAKGLSPQFAAGLGSALAQNDWIAQLNTQLSAALEKNISLTSPLSSGLVPFDLAAPAKHIYPVYSPFRNMIPRTKGQGLQHLAKIITAIQGSGQGLAVPGNRMSISEFNGGSGFGAYPGTNLPGSGSQTISDIAIPYKFFGLTESVSWLAQWAGQGFHDADGLAALILLQESMLLEERALISATSVALSTPSAPGLAVRTANSGETALSGVTTNVFVKVSAVNYFGETVASTGASIAWSSGQVVDVTISPVDGAFAYNLYVTTGASAGTYWLMASGVGATKYTLTGALPTSGSNPQVSDTGTSSTNDYEGMLSAITGHSAGTVYPTGFKGSYVNKSVGDTLNINTLNAALQAMWNGANGVLANPDAVWCEGGDRARLAASIATAGQTGAGYRLTVDQSEVNSMRGGAAITTYVNPITGKDIPLNVHPYFVQGTAMILSMKVPHPTATIANVWENVLVQDYLSIKWPVIDATFRHSLFWYGTLYSPAVQYNGLMQGIQKTTATASAGTNS
jgi:hypothetical protein